MALFVISSSYRSILSQKSIAKSSVCILSLHRPRVGQEEELIMSRHKLSDLISSSERPTEAFHT